jgi:hypothetical protein
MGGRTQSRDAEGRAEKGRPPPAGRADLAGSVDALLGAGAEVHRHLPAVAALLVPELGDACLIHELKEHSELVLAGSAHGDAGAAPLLARLGAAGLRGLPRPFVRALQSGEEHRLA